MTMTRTPVNNDPPASTEELDLEPRGRVMASPTRWKDHIFYQILPDRFSDGGEAGRPLYDPAEPQAFRASDKRAWMEAGLRFNGGTLRGIRSKLDYLQGLGVTGLWLNPVLKQRADLQTYHGYAIQDFLQIDPRFGTLQDLRDLIDDAHDRGMVVVLDVVIDHTANNWFYGPDLTGIIEESLPYRYQPHTASAAGDREPANASPPLPPARTVAGRRSCSGWRPTTAVAPSVIGPVPTRWTPTPSTAGAISLISRS
jgi:hypothetical protein